MATGEINYIAPMNERPRYHANDSSRDVLTLDPQIVHIEDARQLADPPRLDREGVCLVHAPSAVADFSDLERWGAVHRAEIETLILAHSGADHVLVSGSGVLRFGERSALSGRLNNSKPARFVHVDVADDTAAAFAQRAAPPGRALARYAHYNVWRCFTAPPQDVPLALCDARTVARQDLVESDAVFDMPGRPDWSFTGLTIRANPAHRWLYWSNMKVEEALIFKTNDSLSGQSSQVPHSAFDDAGCPADVPPRASIEMRAIALWYG
jgi:hypothetical protein